MMETDHMTRIEPTKARQPAPLEWHPAYRDQTWLLDWLEGRGDLGHLDTVAVPYAKRLPLTIAEPATPGEELYSVRTHRLERRWTWGHAPYVGRPFRYVWRCAVDELGRGIAGESKRDYCT